MTQSKVKSNRIQTFDGRTEIFKVEKDEGSNSIKRYDPQIFKVEDKNKQLMRLFRKFFKTQFTRIHGSRQYSWMQHTRRDETKKFFN